MVQLTPEGMHVVPYNIEIQFSLRFLHKPPIKVFIRVISIMIKQISTVTYCKINL